MKFAISRQFPARLQYPGFPSFRLQLMSIRAQSIDYEYNKLSKFL